jgi:hypothetical protein
VATGLVDPFSELLDSEEEDDDFWGVEDDVCWGGDGEDGDPYLLDWDSMGEPSENGGCHRRDYPLGRLRVEESF